MFSNFCAFYGAFRLFFFACLLCCIGIGSASGSLANLAGVEVFRFNGFTDSTNLILQGDAHVSSNRLHLHSSEFNQSGAAWISSKRYVAGGFECTFQFQITNRAGVGGSGIAFVIQNNPAPVLGGGGPGVGYHGIPNSLVLEFDTKEDAVNGDPIGLHFGWHSRRTLPNGAEETNAFGVVTLNHSGAPNFANGRPQRMHLRYEGTELKLTWEPSTHPTASVSVNLNTYLDLDNGQAWVGFTGATNPDGSETHDLLEWSFSSPSALPVIQVHPQSRTNQAGSAASFAVQATGAEPLFFQWLHNGEPISGETNSVLVINEVATNNAGGYSARVSNALGEAMSAAAVLTATLEGTRKWTFNDAYTASSPAIDEDGTIYYVVGNTSERGGRLIALRPDGSKKWECFVESAGKHAPAIGPDKTIYVSGSDQNLYAINPGGTEKWTFAIGAQPTSSPAVDSNGVIYVAAGARMFAVRPNRTKKWEFPTGNLIYSSPAIGRDGTIYFGSFDRRLYAVNPDGTQKWSYLTGHEIHTSPAIASDGTIFISSYDDKLYALNANGTFKWSQTLGGGDCSPTIGTDGTIYIGRGFNVTAFTGAGARAWTFPTGDKVLGSPAVTADGRLYFGSLDGKFYALSTNGTKLWDVPAGSPIGESSPAVSSDGTIYVGTYGGSLIAFHGSAPLSGSSWPVFRGNLLRNGSLSPAGPPVFTVEPPEFVTTGAGTNLVLSATVIGSAPFSYQWLRDGIVLTNGGNIDGVDTLQLSVTAIRIEQAGDYSIRATNPFGTNAGRISRVSVLPFYQPPGSIIWNFPTSGEVIESPAVSLDNIIYFGTSENKLYSININGISNWTYQATGRLTSPAIGPNGVIYAGVSSNPGVVSPSNTFLAINPNGVKRWEFPEAGAVIRPPAIGYDGTIYVLSYNGELFALSPDGEEIWSKQIGNDGGSTAPAIAADGTVFVGARMRHLQSGAITGHFYALYPDGTTKWHYTNSGGFNSGAAIGSDGNVFIGSAHNNGKFLAFSSLGHLDWEYTSGSSIFSGAVLGSNNVYFSAEDERLFTLQRNGAFQWMTNGAGPAAIGSDGTIYVALDDNLREARLRALNANGHEAWTTVLETWGTTTPPTLTKDGVIYVGAGTNLYAVKASSGLVETSWPIMQANPQHTGNLQQHAVPLVIITNPASGSEFLPGETILLEARFLTSASNIARVDFYANTNFLGSSTSSPFSYSWSEVVSGEYEVRAVATDFSGVSATSGIIKISVNAPPFVEMTSLSSNSVYFNRDNILLKASAFDLDGIARVEFFVANSRLATVTNPPYEILWERAPAGSFQVWAKAFDNLGEVSNSEKVNIRINSYPTASLISPGNQSQFYLGTPVNLLASAMDAGGTIASVEFLNGSEVIGTDHSPQYTASWLPPKPGQYNLRARAFDDDGASTVSGFVTISIVESNPPPIITFRSPLNRELIQMPDEVLISAEISDTNAQVTLATIKVNDVPVASFEHGGQITHRWQPPAPGNYSIKLEAVNSLGQAALMFRQVAVVATEQALDEAVIPSSTSRSNLWVPDGPVHALIETNGVLYIGGAFQNIGQFVAGHGIVELSATAPDLSHPTADLLIDAIIDDTQGGYFVSGLFNQAGGVPRRGIAHVKPDKSIDLEFQADANGHVLAMALSGDTLYVGGEFDEIAGVNQRYVAALDARTGEIKPWNPEPTGWVGALFVTNSFVYLGGNFQFAGGAYRSNLAAVSAETGLAFEWNPSPDGLVTKLAAGNGRLFAVGEFVHLSGEVRNGLGAFDLNTLQLDEFNSIGMEGARSVVEHDGLVYIGRSSGLVALNPITHANQLPNLQVNGSVDSVAVAGDMVYMAGGFSRVNGVSRNRVAAVNKLTGELSELNLNPSGRFELVQRVGDKILGAGTLGLIKVPRRGLAAIDIASGAATAWNPGCDGIVYAMAIVTNQIIVGGQFSNLGGSERVSIGSVHLQTGETSLWRPRTTPQSTTIYSLAPLEQTILAGGVFNQVDSMARGNLAEFVLRNGELTAWNPNTDGAVRSIKIKDEIAYIGGDFSQVGNQPRNRIAALNRFSQEITPWNPNIDGPVRTVEPAENEIYIGGLFTEVGGEPRNSLAAVDKITGQVTPWIANSDGSVSSLQKHGDILLAAGQFNLINGEPRVNAAALQTRTSHARVLDWVPSIGSEDSSSVVYSLLAAQGSVFLGGRFQTSGGAPAPYLAAFDEPSQFGNALPLPGGLFRFNFFAPLGYYYIFEKSADLTTWTPISTNRAPILYEEIITLTNEMLFYRARPLR